MKTQNNPTILVMAGSYEQFELYRQSRGLSLNRLIYLHRPQTAKRAEGSVLVKTGNWSRRRDRRAIEQLIEQGHFSDVRLEETVPSTHFSRRSN